VQFAFGMGWKLVSPSFELAADRLALVAYLREAILRIVCREVTGRYRCILGVEADLLRYHKVFLLMLESRFSL